MNALMDGPYPSRSSAKKIIGTVAALAIALLGLLIFTATSHLAAKDYIEYWASGRLLIHHIDPYSPGDVFMLEKSQGYSRTGPIVMPNPPWSLFLVAPLGFGGVLTGAFLWTLAAIGCIVGFIRLLNVPSKYSIFAFFFAPALACICSGQSSPFLLLGFCLFLRFHQSRPFLAGASLLLMTIKPHLFLIFWVVLLVDCLRRRRYSLLAGGATALVAGTLFTMCFDTHIWQHYFAMLRASVLKHEFFPTISMLFRASIDVNAFWLLFIPSALAILWGLWYYARWRHQWNWRTHGMLLMLVTIVASPYSFFTDEIVLLPAIAFAFSLTERRKYSTAFLIAVNSIALILVLVVHVQLSSRAYMWTPLAWLVWFLYATYKPSSHSQHSQIKFAESPELGKKMPDSIDVDCEC
jgi:Glycosyltransferase family 87